jgi:hypothetical protein
VSASGDAGFRATLNDGSAGIWAPDGLGALELVAPTNTAAPGTFGLFFTDLEDPRMNHSDGAGNVTVVAGFRDPAPGPTPGDLYAELDTQPTIDLLGRVTFGAGLLHAFVGSGALDEVFLATGSTVRPLLNTFGTPFRGVRLLDSNNQGDIAFKEGANSKVTLLSDGLPKPTKPIVQWGDRAPGTTCPIAFANDLSSTLSTRLNQVGGSAFNRTLQTAANAKGIWRADDRGLRGLRKVALEGDPVPHMPGATYKPIDTAPVINGHGAVAMLVDVQIHGKVKQGIFVFDAAESLSPVIMTGTSLTVAGEPRSVTGLMLETDTAGDSTTSFNDGFNIAFRATFDDGSSGVFVSRGRSARAPPAEALCAHDRGIRDGAAGSPHVLEPRAVQPDHGLRIDPPGVDPRSEPPLTVALRHTIERATPDLEREALRLGDPRPQIDDIEASVRGNQVASPSQRTQRNHHQ